MGCIFDARPLLAEPPPNRCPPRLVAVLDSPPCAFGCCHQLASPPPTRTRSLPSARGSSSLERTYLPPSPPCDWCHQLASPPPPRTVRVTLQAAGDQHCYMAPQYSPRRRGGSLRANVRGRRLVWEMHGGRCCDDRGGWTCSSLSFCESGCWVCCDDHYGENAKSYWTMSDETNNHASKRKLSGDPW